MANTIPTIEWISKTLAFEVVKNTSRFNLIPNAYGMRQFTISVPISDRMRMTKSYEICGTDLLRPRLQACAKKMAAILRNKRVKYIGVPESNRNNHAICRSANSQIAVLVEKHPGFLNLKMFGRA